MFKKLLVLTVLFAQMTWLMRPLLPYVEYGLNYEYISEVLCINQEAPELACDGKCYLREKIQQTAEPAPATTGIVPLAPQWDSLASTLDACDTKPKRPASEYLGYTHPLDEVARHLWASLPPTPPPQVG